MYLFEEDLYGSNDKNGEATEERVSIVNCWEALSECCGWGSCENPMGFSMCYSRMESIKCYLVNI